MADAPDQFETLLDLLDQMQTEPLSPEDQDKLRDLLLGSAELRARFIQHTHLVSGLAWLIDPLGPTTPLAAIGDATAPGLVDPPVQRSLLQVILGPARSAISHPVTWSVLAVGVLFAAYVVAISWNMLGREAVDRRLKAVAEGANSNLQPSVYSLSPDADAVATITASEDANWSPHVGKSLRDLHSASRRDATTRAAITPGEPLAITSGLVELELTQGTTLLVEGPAEWSIDGDNNATLKRGKLVARVPQQAIGFTLETPTARIVDLGTEFGVEVKPNGVADVHVVNGQVDVRSTSSTGSRQLDRLQAGQSVQISAAGAKLERTSEVPEKFKRLLAAGIGPGPPRSLSPSEMRLLKISPDAAVSQSSGGRFPPGNALDGSLLTFSHAEGNKAPVWWQVDLGASHQIAAVVLQNRQDCCRSRLRNITIKILADDGATVAESALLNPENEAWGGLQAVQAGPGQLALDLIRTSGKSVQGRFVRVERGPDERPNEASPLERLLMISLAEVEVYTVPGLKQ